MADRTVADVVVDGLLRAGVARLFTGPSTIGPLIAAASRRGLDVVEVDSPAAAAVMAAVTGELTDTPAALVLGAAAAAEAAPGLDYAASGGAPMLVVTDGPPPPSMAASIKASVSLSAEAAGEEVAVAARLALGEPRGPVHLTLAPEVAERPAVAEGVPTPVVPRPTPDPATLDEAAERLASAARPVLVVGLGCRSGLAAKWIRALAETTPAPVLVTPKARGVLPDPHPLSLGEVSAGVSLLARADLLVAVGLGARELATWDRPRAVPVLHLAVTPPPPELAPAVAVLGDVALIIEELAPRLRGRSRADWDVAALDRLKRAPSARPAGAATPPAARVVQIVRELTPAGTIAAAEGAAGALVRAVWQAVGPSELLTAPEPVGFAAAAAMAARLALPDRHAVAFIEADGLAGAGFALRIAARRGAAVLVIALGATAPGIAPLALAEGHGVAGVSAPTEAALLGALTRALGSGAPCLIDARAAGTLAAPV